MQRRIAGMAFALPLLAGCAGLGAGSAGSPYENFEQKAVGETLEGVGLISKQREPIDYRPRPSLAIPPADKRQSLPPPQKTLYINERAWPQDPTYRPESAPDAASDEPVQPANLDRMGKPLSREDLNGKGKKQKTKITAQAPPPTTSAPLTTLPDKFIGPAAAPPPPPGGPPSPPQKSFWDRVFN